MLELASGRAELLVDPAAGGRISQLRVDGNDLLVGRSDDPMRWGCYPMVPFAGRIRRGRFSFDGHDYSLPTNFPPHAIHGFGFTAAWEVTGATAIALDLGAAWPFSARVEQRFALSDSHLRVEMTLRARERQPVTLGWHPWFRRRTGGGDPLRLAFEAEKMFELDHDDIPTGALVEPSEGPWDNCFSDVRLGPILRWGDSLTVTMASSAANWVVFDRPEDAICVEPQTGPPDGLGRPEAVVDRGAESSVWMTLTWD